MVHVGESTRLRTVTADPVSPVGDSRLRRTVAAMHRCVPRKSARSFRRSPSSVAVRHRKTLWLCTLPVATAFRRMQVRHLLSGAATPAPSL